MNVDVVHLQGAGERELHERHDDGHFCDYLNGCISVKGRSFFLKAGIGF